ncbi:MAG: diacylglycerol kinase [Candidatus Omnitrophota bacterium]
MKFIESMNAAIEGIVHVIQSQRNMRLHFLATFLIVLFAIYLNFTGIELMILCVTISIVLSAEIFNTCIELAVDMIRTESHPAAKIVKDVAAGAVLLTAINAIVVGYILFTKRLSISVEDGIIRLRSAPWHITFISLILVFGLVIIGKMVFYKGELGFLRGGMPSGHAALAFSMWALITLLTNNEAAMVLSFMMAFLIARHRVKDFVHSIWEVVAGGLLGALTTALIFQLFF